MQRVPFAAAAVSAVLAAAYVSAPICTSAAPRPVVRTVSNLPLAAAVPRVRLRDLGEAAMTTPITIEVTLNYHQNQQLEQLVETLNDPASPYFRHWLTSEQFAVSFAPTDFEYHRVVESLETAGFHVTQTFSNRTVIDAAGTASTAERYFRTSIHRVMQPGYGIRYTNVRPATLPMDVSDLVYSVNGLNNLAIVHPFFMPVRRARIGAPQAAGAPYTGPVSTLTGYYGYGPLVFAQSYDFPNQHATKANPYDGTGRTAAIVIDADFLNADIATYLKYFGIKRTAKISRIPIDGGTTSDPRLSSGDSVEATLDLEVLAGAVPGAAIDVYQTAPFSWGVGEITDAYNAIVAQNKADVVNSSFGLCESADPTLDKAWDHIAVQGAALGITFHAASGDDGSSCLDGVGVTGVNVPASLPHFVGVGGTSLDVNAKQKYAYESETAWGGSGGGVSTVFTTPAWQKGVKGVLAGSRNVPDVAVDANPLTGFAFYYADTWNNPWDPLGGTSLASPLFGAALTQIDDIVGGRTGLAVQSIYSVFKKYGYKSGGTAYFHDVTSGSNGVFSATAGYDRVTGIGSLDAWSIAQALKK